MGNSKVGFERNTSGLAAHAQRKAQQTRQRVNLVIDQLLAEKRPINFNVVMKGAGVTKSYLYNQSTLRERIEALRKPQEPGLGPLLPPTSREPDRSEKSKEVLLAAKEQRIKKLEEENRRLREQLKQAYSQLYAAQSPNAQFEPNPVPSANKILLIGTEDKPAPTLKAEPEAAQANPWPTRRSP
jgi:hypothetical protein